VLNNILVIKTGFGLGDTLIVSGIIKVLKNKNNKIILITKYPIVFKNNPNIFITIPEGHVEYYIHKIFDRKIIWRCGNLILKKFNKKVIKAVYPFPCKEKHIIDAVAEQFNIRLSEKNRNPEMYLSSEEIFVTKWAQNAICVQSSSTNYWTVNKHWEINKMQKVVNVLSRDYKVIHLGDTSDIKLNNVVDLRGKTTVREAGAILYNSKLFIGLEGGIVHLAKAVNTRSIVIYTGYTKPEETGYSDNINLIDKKNTRSCWNRNECKHCRRSASAIKPSHIIKEFRKICKNEQTYK
jgi:ADP-heptose:LPS heptosyltransferase